MRLKGKAENSRVLPGSPRLSPTFCSFFRIFLKRKLRLPMLVPSP
jgi:hypothetical protein